jgi:putative ABC transport system permease protein
MSRSDRRIRLHIVWRSLRWRLGSSLIMLTVATLGIAAASFGPIFLRGGDESVLQATLRAADPSNVGLSLLAVNDRVSPAQLRHAAQSVPAGPAGQGAYGSMIVTADASIETVAVGSTETFRSDLIARTGMCRQLTLTTGSCPRGAREVALSDRSAQSLHLHVGDHAVLEVPSNHDTVTLTVTALFRPGNPQAPEWWGQNYFGYGEGSSNELRLDDFVTTERAMSTLPPPGRSPLLAQLPLRPAALTSQTVVGYALALAQYERTAPVSLHVDASTELPTTLRQATGDEHTMTTIVAVVLVQLVLLSLIVLYFAAARLAEAREPDLRLAELRGFTRSGRASVALTEPVGILAVALPFGVLIAWLAGHAVASSLFDGLPPGIDPLAIGAAVITFVAGVGATALAARNSVLRPRRADDGAGATSGKRSMAMAMALDALASALAVAAFVEVAIAGVASGSHTDPLAALAPGLLAVAVGIAGARLLPWGSALGVRLTRNSRWVGTTMATRRLSRLQALSRHVVVLSVAVGLATFAVTGWAVAGRNRSARSAFDVGASTVLNVEARPGVDFLHAVRQADPTGRRAMAAVVEHASDGVTLAVDAPRLAAIAAWPASLNKTPVATLARVIAKAKAPPIDLTGTELRVSAELLRGANPAATLEATVFDNGYDSDTTVDLGPLKAGPHQYKASFSGGCQPSCQLVGLSFVWTPPDRGPAATAEIALRVSGIAAKPISGPWAAATARLGHPADWQGTAGDVDLSGSPSGLDVRATVVADGSPTSIGPADVPKALPVVLVGARPADTADDLGVGLDGATINVRPVATISALPGVGVGATMADLSLAQLFQSGPMIDTQLQVWLSAGPTAPILRRLHALGITPTSAATAAGKDAALSRDGISLAYDFFLLAAVVAGVLAVGSTAFALIAAARRRESELASLQAIGVGPLSLRRSLRVEQGLIIGVGLVLGSVAGIVTALVALRSIPEFVSSAAAPAPDYRLPMGPVGLVLVAIVIVLAVAVGLSTRLVVKRASVDRTGSERV